MKVVLMEIFLRVKINMNEAKTKKLGFRYFRKFLTWAFTPRPRNTYSYGFQALFGSFKF